MKWTRHTRLIDYSSYDEYLAYQRRRASRSRGSTSRRTWFREVLGEKVHELRPVATILLCLGARHDDDVEDFIHQGFDAEGIDLFDTSPINNFDMSKPSIHPKFRDRCVSPAFSYDAASSITRAPGLHPGGPTTYTYNAVGQRTAKEVDSIHTKSIWDEENILVETDASNVTYVTNTLCDRFCLKDCQTCRCM